MCEDDYDYKTWIYYRIRINNRIRINIRISVINSYSPYQGRGRENNGIATTT